MVLLQVGNAFVTQYYNVLHQVPQYVFRFYTDDSHLTHANAGSSGEIQMANTQNVSIAPSLSSHPFLYNH